MEERSRNMKMVCTTIPTHIHFKLINRARYYDVSLQDFMYCAAELFIEGALDEALGIPTEKTT